MVDSSVFLSFALSDFSRRPLIPLSHHPVYLFLFPPPVGDPPSWPLYPWSRSGPFPLSAALLILPLPSSSARFCQLDSFLLSRRERLNSLRPLFAPVSLSSFPSVLSSRRVATPRPPTAEIVKVEIRVSRLSRNSLSMLFIRTKDRQ